MKELFIQAFKQFVSDINSYGLPIPIPWAIITDLGHIKGPL
jgi:hypothetical protein